MPRVDDQGWTVALTAPPRGFEMDQIVIVESRKSIDEVCHDLEQAVAENRFGILHVHDLRKTLAAKGFTLGFEARVFDVCNPQRALEVLSANPVLSVALPCAISVFTEGGKTKLAFIRPTAMLGLFGSGAQEVAEEVEAAVMRIVERAAV